MVQFTLEPASPDLFSELAPLFALHHVEISQYQDLELAPNYEMYLTLQQAGMIRAYIARKDGMAVGYSFVFVHRHPHFNSLQAVQSALFIIPEHRGFGLRFIKWVDQQLAAEGVVVSYQNVSVKHDFGPLLKRAGYRLVDHCYAHRLDQGRS